jgi:hypothetical protein
VSECLLRKANGRPDSECQEVRCTFWRFVEQADLPAEPEWMGCAIQHFALLEGGEPVAAWLLSVKERLEGVSEETVACVLPTEVLDPRD